MISSPLLREHDRQLIDLQPSHNGNKEYNGSCNWIFGPIFSGSKFFFYKTSFWFPCSNLNFVNHILLPDHKLDNLMGDWSIKTLLLIFWLLYLGDDLLFTSIPSIQPVTQDAINLGIGLGSASLLFATSTKQQRHFPPLPLV
jgi:hypothetical protein